MVKKRGVSGIISKTRRANVANDHKNIWSDKYLFWFPFRDLHWILFPHRDFWGGGLETVSHVISWWCKVKFCGLVLGRFSGHEAVDGRWASSSGKKASSDAVWCGRLASILSFLCTICLWSTGLGPRHSPTWSSCLQSPHRSPFTPIALKISRRCQFDRVLGIAVQFLRASTGQCDPTCTLMPGYEPFWFIQESQEATQHDKPTISRSFSTYRSVASSWDE